MDNFRKKAEEKIKNFFEKGSLNPEGVKKIKKLAMKHRIRLGNYRKRFCKKCYSDLKNSVRRIKNNTLKMICADCRYVNRYKLKLS